MTERNASQYQSSAAAHRAVAAVPPVGAPRPGSFWQRWKEWERDLEQFQRRSADAPPDRRAR